MTEQDRPHPPLEPPHLSEEPPPSPGSEAQAAELAALEAMLPPPAGEPAVAPDVATGERLP
ncbi:MAG TPA: hypothetical protein VEZ47_07360 [Gemmatirosa sp.]|nr:hypothetical protein [Gemmatirosa sp.]